MRRYVAGLTQQMQLLGCSADALTLRCPDATPVVVTLADKAKCEVTVHFNVLVASPPGVPMPGTMLGLIGRSITAEAPLNFSGLLPINYQAQPVLGCPGKHELLR